MNRLAIVFWSGTGNTEAMAKAIGQGAETAGVKVDWFSAEQFSAAQADTYDKIASGCPSMGSEELEDATFEPMFSLLEAGLSGKAVALFGSYGWGDGQWMRDWEERCASLGAKVFRQEGLIVNGEPDAAAIDSCEAFGREFAES